MAEGVSQHIRSDKLSRSPGRWALDVVTRSLIPMIVIALLSLSGGVLWVLGYNYDGLTGSALTKIHPATYLTVIAFAWRSVASGNPFLYVDHVSAQRPATALLVVLTTIIFVFVILQQMTGSWRACVSSFTSS